MGGVEIVSCVTGTHTPNELPISSCL